MTEIKGWTWWSSRINYLFRHTTGSGGNVPPAEISYRETMIHNVYWIIKVISADKLFAVEAVTWTMISYRCMSLWAADSQGFFSWFCLCMRLHMHRCLNEVYWHQWVSCTHLSGLTILAHFMMKLGPKLKQHKSSWNLISQYATLKLKIKTIKKLLPENIKDVLHSQPVLILFFCWQSSVWSLHDMMGWRGCDMISVVSILSNTCQGSDLYV